MNYKMSFQERARLGMEKLSNQYRAISKKAEEQVKQLQTQSSSKRKKVK